MKPHFESFEHPQVLVCTKAGFLLALSLLMFCRTLTPWQSFLRLMQIQRLYSNGKYSRGDLRGFAAEASTGRKHMLEISVCLVLSPFSVSPGG